MKVSEEESNNMTKQELYEIEHMYLWYCVTCPCCFDKQSENNGEDKNVGKEEIIETIKNQFKMIDERLLKCAK